MSINANAQFYDSNNAHYYIGAGKSIGDANFCIIVFDGDKAYLNSGSPNRSMLVKDMNKYDMAKYTKEHHGATLYYDSGNSTSSRTVYTQETTRVVRWVGFNAETEPDGGYVYRSIANDKSEMIVTFVSPTGATTKKYLVEVSEWDIKNYSPSVNRNYLHE